MAATSAYREQLEEAAGLICELIGHDGGWDLVYQSRSGPPQVPWLEPDIGDHLRSLAEAGQTDVVVCPLGFVSDHMEVKYDLDTLAAAAFADGQVDVATRLQAQAADAAPDAVRDDVSERLQAYRDAAGG